MSLPGPLRAEVDAGLESWRTGQLVQRLWARDASLWTGGDEERWLGWLDEPARQAADASRLAALALDVRTARFSHALLIGMGGSSLFPGVLTATFGPQEGFPELLVLDSTDPAVVRGVTSRLDLARTLFIVSSKSGTTLEPNLLAAYFFDVARRGSRFVAITDPGSPLETLARERDFWEVFPGAPDVGGRFSALSYFGLVPAAAMGLDVDTLLQRSLVMVDECRPGAKAAENPGLVLGVVMGTAARMGRDKLTLVFSPALSALGTWVEQLVAESTGKRGVAIIPVEGERPGPPGSYGDDRLFVYTRLASGADPAQDDALTRLAEAGVPVVTLRVSSTFDLGKELFRWEMATAVAGAILGVNPFDQPDVEASKAATRALTAEFERAGRLPADQQPRLADPELPARLRALFDTLRPGDYFAVLAYLDGGAEHAAVLNRLRHRVRDATGAATCLGFGPRYLHSTGQAFKGGPNTGVFLLITCDDAEDLPVPGRPYTFGVVKAAQARGDFTVMVERERRVLRVHLSARLAEDLETLDRLVASALD